MSERSARRRFLAPEAVQASPMDCGPTALHAMLTGFGRTVSFARLREACQTDVDGTSINALEEVAQALGLDAVQVLVPVDHVGHHAARNLPAIAVTRLPSGAPHFVLVWRRLGPWLQVMDPASGRRWVRVTTFRRSLHVHGLDLPAETWRRFAGTPPARAALIENLEHVGHRHASRRVNEALADPHWLPVAALEAAVRMVQSLVGSGAVDRGNAAERLVDALCERARATAVFHENGIPAIYWSVRPYEREAPAPKTLHVRGALLVQALRLRGKADTDTSAQGEIREALTEPVVRVGRAIWSHVQGADRRQALGLALGVIVAAFTVLVQALVFRALFELGALLRVDQQRLAAATLLVGFLAALVLLELPIENGLLRLGRHLEARLRVTLQRRLPLLPQRWFDSRPGSDVAERAHSLFSLSEYPRVAGRLTRAFATLGFTAAGLAWLDPSSWPFVLLAVGAGLGLPFAFQRALSERELLVRGHHGALSRFYLEALLGMVAARVHGAERALRREHESLLVEWFRAGLKLARSVVFLRLSTSLAATGLAILLVVDHLQRGGTSTGTLLFAYWAIALPALGEQVAQTLLQTHPLHNAARRALEPLGGSAAQTRSAAPHAEEEAGAAELRPMPSMSAGGVGKHVLKAAGAAGSAASAPVGPRPSRPGPAPGVALEFESVDLLRSGHPVLSAIALRIQPGEHVALVGRSGAGKSSLLALVLGLQSPSRGRVLVDGERLAADALEHLRRSTAWIDPTVQLWNRSAFENLVYGTLSTTEAELARAMDEAELGELASTLPSGLATRLGEGGTFVSGGEGQRLRLARGLLRTDVRLALLDEPFRGIDRTLRRTLLQRARERWRGATLLCATHDLEETLRFDRVLVVEAGRIVADGDPAQLAREPDSAYAQLLAAERDLMEKGWRSDEWQRWRVAHGRLHVHESASGDGESS